MGEDFFEDEPNVNVEYVYDNYLTNEHIVVNDINKNTVRQKVIDDRNSGLGENMVLSLEMVHEFSMPNFERVEQIATRSSSTLNGENNLSKSPYSGICQLYLLFHDVDGNSIYKSGSGCFVSENVILTAAHCLYDSTYGSPDSIRIYYCFEATNSSGVTWGNLAFCSAVSSMYCTTYSTNVETMYDYGIINVASYAGQNTGVFKLATITPTKSTVVTVIGYPSPTTNSNGFGSSVLSIPNAIKISSGNLDKIVSNYYRAKYSILETEQGMSGGALLVLDSDNYYQLLGITTNTRTILFTKYSYFCRVETSVKAFCNTWGDTNNVPSSLYLMGEV